MDAAVGALRVAQLDEEVVEKRRAIDQRRDAIAAGKPHQIIAIVEVNRLRSEPAGEIGERGGAQLGSQRELGRGDDAVFEPDELDVPDVRQRAQNERGAAAAPQAADRHRARIDRVHACHGALQVAGILGRERCHEGAFGTEHDVDIAGNPGRAGVVVQQHRRGVARCRRGGNRIHERLPLRCVATAQGDGIRQLRRP